MTEEHKKEFIELLEAGENFLDKWDAWATKIEDMPKEIPWPDLEERTSNLGERIEEAFL